MHSALYDAATEGNFTDRVKKAFTPLPLTAYSMVTILKDKRTQGGNIYNPDPKAAAFDAFTAIRRNQTTFFVLNSSLEWLESSTFELWEAKFRRAIPSRVPGEPPIYSTKDIKSKRLFKRFSSYKEAMQFAGYQVEKATYDNCPKYLESGEICKMDEDDYWGRDKSKK
jgi:hypothetical protein